eukprot:3397066-Pyramimonas_sp.AAC.1
MVDSLSDASGDQVEQQTADTRSTIVARTLQLWQGLGGGALATSRPGATARRPRLCFRSLTRW